MRFVAVHLERERSLGKGKVDGSNEPTILIPNDVLGHGMRKRCRREQRRHPGFEHSRRLRLETISQDAPDRADPAPSLTGDAQHHPTCLARRHEPATDRPIERGLDRSRVAHRPEVHQRRRCRGFSAGVSRSGMLLRTVGVMDGGPIGRRMFLGIIGVGAVGVVAGSAVQGWLERNVAPIIGRDPTGLLALLPIGRFRIYTVTGGLPDRSRDAYRLRVHGLVERELDLSFDDLIKMPATDLVRDFQCVTGWRVRDVPWKGVRLRDVLDRAGVRDGGHAVRFVSFDGTYSESLTLEQARRDDVLVAYELEGEPLSSAHGGPARLYVAPMYGYKSLKWLRAIEVTPRVVPGFWETRGYDLNGWVGRSNGRDDEPA